MILPRRNAPTQLRDEEYLAQNIAMIREEKGWSYEGLARRLTDVGYPMHPSALHKIEKLRPRRRITVNELVAFSAVFQVPIEDLLVDPSVRMDAAAKAAIEDLFNHLVDWHLRAREYLEEKELLEGKVLEMAQRTNVARYIGAAGDRASSKQDLIATELRKLQRRASGHGQHRSET